MKEERKRLVDLDLEVLLLGIVAVILAFSIGGTLREVSKVRHNQVEDYIELQREIRDLRDDYTDLNFYLQSVEKELHQQSHYIDEMWGQVFEGA